MIGTTCVDVDESEGAGNYTQKQRKGQNGGSHHNGDREVKTDWTDWSPRLLAGRIAKLVTMGTPNHGQPASGRTTLIFDFEPPESLSHFLHNHYKTLSVIHWVYHLISAHSMEQRKRPKRI